jgi:hypothetical protein
MEKINLPGSYNHLARQQIFIRRNTMIQDTNPSTVPVTGVAEEERIDAFCRTLGVILRQNKDNLSVSETLNLPKPINSQ